MENRTSFHDAYTQPTRAGFGPASSGSAATNNRSAPRHIKAAALTRCVATLQNKPMGLLILRSIVLALFVVSTARRAPWDGYFERVLTLYFSCCTLLRCSLGVCASCQTVLLFRFLYVTCAPHRGRMFSFVLPDFPAFRLVIISCQPPTWPDVPIVDSTFTSVPGSQSGSCYICNLCFRKPAVQIFRQECSISRDSCSIRQIHNVPYRVCITVHHSGWRSCLRNVGRELRDSGHRLFRVCPSFPYRSTPPCASESQ